MITNIVNYVQNISEGASSSDSDVDHYVISEKLLDSTFSAKRPRGEGSFYPYPLSSWSRMEHQPLLLPLCVC